MKKQRILSIILAALMTATACGTTAQPNGGGDNTTSQGNTGDTTAGETGRADAKDNLPEKNYNGAEFTILYRNEWAYEFVAEEENGDIINDAILRRNRAVEDRFNVTLNLYGVQGTYDAAEFRDAVNNSVLAGDSEYDLVAGYQANRSPPRWRATS